METQAPKEPWEQTRLEWESRNTRALPGMHQSLVETALKEGKTVPPEVLADYPWLGKKSLRPGRKSMAKRLNWYKAAADARKTIVLDRKDALEELFSKRSSILTQLREMADSLIISAEECRSATPNITSERANHYESWAHFIQEAMRKIGNPIPSKKI